MKRAKSTKHSAHKFEDMKLADAVQSATSGGNPPGTGGVTRILAGTNITIDPTSGLGDVTINSTAGGSSAGPKVFSGAVVIGTNNQPGPYLMSSVKYHDDFNTGAFSVEIDPNAGEVHVIVPVPNYNGTPPLLGNTAVAYAWNGPFPAPIFGTATDHNGPQLQVDGIYWRFPQTTWPQYGVIIPIQATQWPT